MLVAPITPCWCTLACGQVEKFAEERAPTDLWGLPREEDRVSHGSVGRKPLATRAVDAPRLNDLIVMLR
jgi:hypothetical protein